MTRLPRLGPVQRRAARSNILILAGFGCLVAAAWVVGLVFGLVALGLALLIVEYLSGDGGGR